VEPIYATTTAHIAGGSARITVHESTIIKKNNGKCKNHSTLPNGYLMSVFLSYSRLLGMNILKTAKMDHTHKVGDVEYNL